MSGYFDQSARLIESRCVVITSNNGVPVHVWCNSIVPMFANGIWYLSSDYRTSLGISCQIIMASWYTRVRVSGPTHHWFRYSGNGLSPVRLGHYLKQWWFFFSTRHWETNVKEKWIKKIFSNKECLCEKFVYKMSTILFWSRWCVIPEVSSICKQLALSRPLHLGKTSFLWITLSCMRK